MFPGWRPVAPVKKKMLEKRKEIERKGEMVREDNGGVDMITICYIHV
jgi:hypothetical protein